jgi:hypothetical protein
MGGMGSSTMAGQSSLVQRMIRAARLEPDLYEEVEADQTATTQALIVVVIVAVASGIGALLSVILGGAPDRSPIGAFIGPIISSLLGWLVWSYVTYFIGTRLFAGQATPGEMLRTIGFAQSPGVLNVLAFIPVLGAIISIVTIIWLLIAGVVAVRQALDFDTGKAILTTIAGWLALAAITFALALLGFGAAVAVGS